MLEVHKHFQSNTRGFYVLCRPSGHVIKPKDSLYRGHMVRNRAVNSPRSRWLGAWAAARSTNFWHSWFLEKFWRRDSRSSRGPVERDWCNTHVIILKIRPSPVFRRRSGPLGKHIWVLIVTVRSVDLRCRILVLVMMSHGSWPRSSFKLVTSWKKKTTPPGELLLLALLSNTSR